MLTELLKKYSKREIVDKLTPFLSAWRIARIETVLLKRLRRVQVALEAPYDIHNGFAVVRTAEALGLDHIHFIRPIMGKGSGRSVTKGSLKWIHLLQHSAFNHFLQTIDGFTLAGAVIEGSSSLEELPIERPLCFLFGNEKSGLSDEAKKKCDFLFSIPCFGMAESYNLSVAAALTLFHFTLRKRKAMTGLGDLTSEEMIDEKAVFYIRALGLKQAQLILERKCST